MKLNHRKDIDGIRGISVLAVIFYHANVNLFSGGYLGVDIFFVISGYLITLIINEELKRKKFKIFDFYERRIRRIIPILYVLIFCIIPIVIIHFLPTDGRNFFESVFSITTFSSNILFWLEEGEYFTRDNSLKPLLHTWSLSVEMQFYLIFPLLLLFLEKLKKYKLNIVFTITLISMFSSFWMSGINQDANFYLLITRIWEILAGSICYYIVIKKKKIEERICEVFSFLAIFIIFISFFFFDTETRHPSYFTLLPIVSTMILICFSQNTYLVKQILENRVINFFGLISYSLYLIHFPVFAIIDYKGIEVNLLLILPVIIFFSFLSWKYIEKPFRDRKKISSKIIFSSYFSVSLLLAIIGLMGHFFIKDKTDNFSNEDFISPKFITDKSIMVLGDSHASQYSWGLKEYFGDDKVEDHSAFACIPLFNLEKIDSRRGEGFCRNKMSNALNLFIEDSKYETLILSNMGPIYLDGEAFQNKFESRLDGLKVTHYYQKNVKDAWKIFEISMNETFQKLSQLGENKKIIYIIDIPELGVSDRSCDLDGKKISFFGRIFWLRNPQIKDCYVSKEEYLMRSKRYNNLVKKIAKNFPKITIFEPSVLICNKQKCNGILNNQRLYKDPDHLSKYGSFYLGKHLSELILNSK